MWVKLKCTSAILYTFRSIFELVRNTPSRYYRRETILPLEYCPREFTEQNTRWRTQ